jgi:hypothetical protein
MNDDPKILIGKYPSFEFERLHKITVELDLFWWALPLSIYIGNTAAGIHVGPIVVRWWFPLKSLYEEIR